MHSFCTYFDANYLDRGISLSRSLRMHCPGAHLYVCCLDQKTFDVFHSLALPDVTLIHLDEIESAYTELSAVKLNRSKVEYYFTITPSLVRFILERESELTQLTYIDSDLLFFSTPEPLFEEMRRRDANVGIIAHRFTKRLEHLALYGTYNVGWITFKKSDEGMSCLLDWQRRCIEWCYDRVEEDRFADQKYLDEWPRTFKGVVVLDHPGANVALWNLDTGAVKENGGQLEVYGQPLVFYHFHGLSQITKHLFFTGVHIYGIQLDKVVLKEVYGRYVLILRAVQRELRSVEVQPLLRYKHSPEDIEASKRGMGDSGFLLAFLWFAFPPPLTYWRWAEWRQSARG